VRRFLGAFLRALAAWLATPFLLLAALALVILACAAQSADACARERATHKLAHDPSTVSTG
jgi:cell division protein FtsB